MSRFISVAEAIVSHPVTWGVATLVFAALSFSPKFSMTGAAILLLLGWAVGCVGIVRSGMRRNQKIASCLLLGVTLGAIGYWIAPTSKLPPAATEPQTTLPHAQLSPTNPEAMRRRDLLEKLRQEYILSHDNVSPSLMAGMEQPPVEWINKKLRESGERWGVSAPSQEKSSATGKREPRPQTPPATPSSKGPRLGIGPEAYKDLSDEQVGQWAVEEADKIAGMAEDCMNKSMAAMKEKRSGNAERWFFSNDFKKCCAQDVKDLRTEILRRLGPPGKDPKEESALEMLFPAFNIPSRPDDINPMAVTEYAKHLRRLGLKLKRRSVPRAVHRELRFTEQQITPEKSEFPYKILITVYTDKEITAGYIVVQWSGNWGVIHGHDLEDGVTFFSTDIMDNEPLSKFLEANRDPLPYSIQIGKTPFNPNKPMHVLASSNKAFHAARVILFDL